MNTQPPDNAVLTQAADWFATLQDIPVSTETRHAWQRWLHHHPSHAQAWAMVEQIDQQFRHLPAAPARQALAAAGKRRRQFLLSLGATVAALPALWVSGRTLVWPQADYRTAVGEQRELTLPDGTRLWLNTDTAVRLHYSTEARELTLVRGEVLVTTAAAPRPWRLRSHAGTAQPLGTRFTVRDHGDHLLVRVHEGRVALTPRTHTDATLTVPASHRARLWPDHTGPLEQDHGGAPTWPRGMLVADNQRLADFLNELARYRPGLLHCDPAVADLRLVGAYPLHDTDRVLEALASSLPVRIQQPLPWYTRVLPR